MKRFITGMLIAALAVTVASVAMAQEEAHYEGYFYNSANPPVNPNPLPGMGGRGLVTAIYAPMISNFVANEYTWVIDGLLPTGNTVVGTTTYTSYDVSTWPATMTMYEDPANNARPTFYFCPSDIHPLDPRYSDGPIYLKGHFVSFSSQYDVATQQGTFTGQMNWDGGSANGFGKIAPGRRGAYTFGGTTSQFFACIPFAAGYDQAMTGRIFQLTTGAKHTTWGQLRNLYSK